MQSEIITNETYVGLIYFRLLDANNKIMAYEKRRGLSIAKQELSSQTHNTSRLGWPMLRTLMNILSSV